MTSDDADAGFFRNLSGLATEYVRQKRKALQSEPETNVDNAGGSHTYQFGGQDVTFEDLRDIKNIRDSGGQVAQLMEFKSLLNFGEGVEIHVENDDETEQIVDGEPMTLSEWLTEEAFPRLDLTVLELGEDALWYPAAYGELQETRAGDFKRPLGVEPWTVLPETNGKGEVARYIQRTQNAGGGYTKNVLQPDELWSIILNRSSSRDQTGISEVLRNRDEIQAFKENEQAINQAIELHGFPQRHIKVGKEDGAPVRDGDLRRLRTIFDPRSTDANTAYFTGQDVDVETLEAHQFDYEAIHEMDMRNLTTALGLPLEAGNVGSDGLGSGKPAELRFSLLKLTIKANQRSFGVQFVENVMKPVIRDYSPFDHTANISMEIDDPLEDIGEVADVLNSVGDYVRNDKAASMLDLPEPEDDEVAESYRSPGDIEKVNEEGTSEDGPFGGMLNSDADAGDSEDFRHRCMGEGVTQDELAHAPEWDQPLLEMYQGVTDPESDPSRALVSFSSSGTPEFVLERIRDAIRGGAIFSDIDGVPSDEIMQFRSEFKENLATDDFTLDSVTDAVMQFTGEGRDNAEMTARTEMSSVLNTAREGGYQDRGEAQDGLFYWTGAEPGDSRQTEACRLLIERTNPFHGGEPVPLEELRSLLTWAAEQDPDMDASMVREDNWIIHIGERSTFSKAPPGWQDL